jgi:phosphoenolpyruvate-protein kinase (PTS system EI component)
VPAARGHAIISNPAICELGELPAPAVLNRSRRRWITACAAGEKYRAAAAGQRRHRQRDLEAHRSLATDASLRQHLLGGLLTGLSCAQAIVASGEHFCAQFSDSGNRYLQERVLDIRDVCFQLLQHIYGEARFPAPGKLTVPAICLADELTPSQFLELDKTLLKGLLLRSGGHLAYRDSGAFVQYSDSGGRGDGGAAAVGDTSAD